MRDPFGLHAPAAIPAPIEYLSNNGIRVLLMRRTGNDTVKTSIGYRDAYGNIKGWFGSRAPTHYCSLPAFPEKTKGD